jgi:ABC-type nickel/cobalt efflux system permease component RcnA
LFSGAGLAGLLALGAVLGMKHALEPDHVAAVAALATRSRSVRHTVWQGIAWGTGHTLTLFIFGGIVLAMRRKVPDQLALGLECAVAVMLIVLGIDVLRRLRRDRVHFHVHRHDDGVIHVHAHSHAHDTAPHDAAHHHHGHAAGLPLRALFVGMMHGMAGTAALIVLMVGTAKSILSGLAQIAAFGVGSIAGMAALSLVIALPLRATAHFFDRANRALQALTGCATLALGAFMLVRLTAA